MKTDLSRLNFVEQLVLVMDHLRRRHAAGQKTTFASDLLSRFKHRGLKTHSQRIEHFSKLLSISSKALCGENVEKLVREAQRAAVVYEVGDPCEFGGEACRVLDVMPDDKLRILTLDGPRIVRRADVEAIVSVTSPAALPYKIASANNS